MSGARRWRRVAVAGVVAGVGALVVGAAAWNEVARARAELGEARESLLQTVGDHRALLTEAGRSALRISAADAIGRIGAVERRLRRSLPLRLAGALPGFSAQRRGVLELVADARAAAAVGLRLVDVVEDFAEQDRVRRSDVPLSGMRRLRTRLEQAGQDLAVLAGGEGGLWGGLRDARRRLDRATQDVAVQLRDAAGALGAAETFLGSAGPRRYLVAIQNNAEMRDQGMVLSFALVSVEGGRLAVERAGPITELELTRPISYPLPAGMRTVFGDLAPDRLWQSVNATADFAWSGRAMAEMALQATGTRVDGVIGLDVPALAGLLRVVGPVSVDGVPVPIDAGNAADLLLNRLYADFPRLREQGERRELLGRVGAAVVSQLGQGTYDALRLGSELGEAAAGGHLRLWSDDGEEQAVFERRNLGGGPGASLADRTIHLSVQNATATKLDYFVKPRVEVRVTLSRLGTAVIDTEVIVANHAPASAGASYQFGPDGFAQARPGQYISRVYFWGPHRALQPGSVEESGLRLSQGPTTVEPGGERSVRFQTVIPDAVRDGRLVLRLVPQPRVEPMPLRVRLVAEGWDVGGPRTYRRPWDRTLTLSWELRR